MSTSALSCPRKIWSTYDLDDSDLTGRLSTLAARHCVSFDFLEYIKRSRHRLWTWSSLILLRRSCSLNVTMAHTVLYVTLFLFYGATLTCHGHGLSVHPRSPDADVGGQSTTSSSSSITTSKIPQSSPVRAENIGSSFQSNSTISIPANSTATSVASVSSATCTPYLVFPKDGLDEANAQISSRLSADQSHQIEVIRNPIMGIVYWLVCWNTDEVTAYRDDPLVLFFLTQSLSPGAHLSDIDCCCC